MAEWRRNRTSAQSRLLSATDPKQAFACVTQSPHRRGPESVEARVGIASVLLESILIAVSRNPEADRARESDAVLLA
jgi:hypothetical protein